MSDEVCRVCTERKRYHKLGEKCHNHYLTGLEWPPGGGPIIEVWTPAKPDGGFPDGEAFVCYRMKPV